jgi:capsular polysaccharide biosynthesis protein
MMYGLPSELYSDTHRLFNASTNYDSKNKGVLLLERRELSRNFKHSERVSKKISKWAQSQGLTFKSINTSSLGFEDIRRNFQEAKFIFAIHGGANYNIIWAEPKTTFVEFIPTRATDSLASLAISYGLDYLPYALNHDKGDFEFEVKESDLELIFKTLESTHI